MRALPLIVGLLVMTLSPLSSAAHPEDEDRRDGAIVKELRTSLRRIANALERSLASRDAELDLRQVEFAASVLQLRWERIGRLRNAAEAADQGASAAEETARLHEADIEILEDRERDHRSRSEEMSPEEYRRESRHLREERKRLEAGAEQLKERAWRLRDQAQDYRSEIDAVRSDAAILEKVISRWLEKLK